MHLKNIGHIYQERAGDRHVFGALGDYQCFCQSRGFLFNVFSTKPL